MARLARVSTYVERLEMVTLTQEGLYDAAVARVTGWSRWTVRKYRRRAARTGPAGLVPPLGRPATGPLSTFAPAIATALLQWRHDHPGWGPQTLRRELIKDARFAGHKLPSRACIAVFLKVRSGVRAYQHHTSLPQPPPARSTAAHEEWELDAQGVVQVPGVGQVCLINLLDTYSHVLTDSLPVRTTATPRLADYQLACRRAFLRFGLPQRITLDHDTVFIESTCPSPFPRRFHLWLLGLGIAVRFITAPPPREHSHIERGHRTLAAQALGAAAVSWADFTAQVDARRTFLNTDYPSRSLGYRAPLAACPAARHSGRVYSPQLEAVLFDLRRVDAYLASLHWLRPVTPTGQVWLHDARYGVGREWAGHTLTIRFDPEPRAFVFYAEDGHEIVRHPAQNLAPADLMGELPPWAQFETLQLHLPLTPEARRAALLDADARDTLLWDFVPTLGGTT